MAGTRWGRQKGVILEQVRAGGAFLYRYGALVWFSSEHDSLNVVRVLIWWVKSWEANIPVTKVEAVLFFMT